VATKKEPSTIEARKAREQALLLEQLRKVPIVQIACEKAGIGRATYYRWRRDDKSFKRETIDALDQGVEYINDISESQLITLIKEKKLPAIALWLKNNHPRFSSKQNLHTPVSATEDLSPEEQKLMIEALRLASGGSVRAKSHAKNN
jgi:hypothetical protein